MSLKELVRAGEGGGRVAAVRQELLPAQAPLSRPTRDVCASNRSHSLAPSDRPSSPPSRPHLPTPNDPLEKQANILYTRQFRALARLLGNEAMDFEQLRLRIEQLILRDPADPALLQKVQQLERELARRNQVEAARSAQSLPASTHDYLRPMETELSRKSKLTGELHDPLKREAYEEAYQGLQSEVAEKVQSLRQVEEQLQETRVRSAAHIGTLEEELVKRNQTIQKLTFELDSLRRKLQSSTEQAQRARQRETELSASLESETKVSYNGTAYTLGALLLELNSRDQELESAGRLQRQAEAEVLGLRAEIQAGQNALRKSEVLAQSLTARVEYQESVGAKLAQECAQLREERAQLEELKMGWEEEKIRLLGERGEREEEGERVRRELVEVNEEKYRLGVAVGQQQAALAQYEVSQLELMQDRDNYASKLAHLQQIVDQQTNTHTQLQADLHHSTQERQTLLSQTQHLKQELAQLTLSHQQQEHQLQLLSQQVQLRTQEAIGREQTIEELHRQLESKLQQAASLQQTETELTEIHAQLQHQLQQAELHVQQTEQQARQMEASLREMEGQLREKEEAALFQVFQLQQVEKQREENHEYLQEEQKMRKVVQARLEEATLKQQEMATTIATLTLQLTQLHPLQAKLSQSQLQLQSQHNLTQSLTQQLAHSEEEAAHLRSQAEQLQQQLAQTQEQLTQLAQLNAVETQLRGKERIERELRAELEEAGSRQRRLEEELQRSKLQQIDAEEDFNKERQNYHAQLAHLQDSLQTLHRQLEDQKHISEEEAAQREHLQQECHAIRLSLTRLQQTEQTLQSDNTHLHTLNQQLQQTIAQLQTHLSSETQHWQAEKNGLQDELRAAEEQLQSNRARYEKELMEQEATYNYRVEERERQVVGLEEERNQLEHLVAELRSEREELVGQLKEAQHSPLQQELPRSDLGFFSFNSHSHPDSPRQTQQRIEELQRQLETYRLREDRLTQLSYSNGQDSPNCNQEDTSHQIGELHEQVDNLRDQLQQQEMALKEWEGEREEWQEELEKKEIKCQQLLQEATTAQLAIFNLTQTTKQHEQQFAQLQKTIGSLQETVQIYQNDIARLQQQLQHYERQQHQDQQFQHERTELKNRIAYLEHELETLQQTNHQNRQKIVYLQTGSLTARAQLKEISEKNQALLSENSQLREVVYNSSQEAERYRQQLAELPKQEERPAPFSHISRVSASSRGREEAPSSDGELTNRILNDPSKISGQDSKFAHLVFENSKIHIVREPRPEIKEKEQEDSNIRAKPQEILQNTPERKTPAAVPREVAAEKEKSKKEEYKIVIMRQEQRHSLANSLTSIKQAEEQQEMSAREQTSPPSSRQTITVSRQNTPSQPTSNNLYSGSQRLSFQEKPVPFRPSFQKSSLPNSNLPVYVGRQSIVVQSQADRRQSNSQSGSKSKVRISYGLVNDRSFEIRKRESERGMPQQASEISHGYQRPSTQEHSISHISPVAMRQSEIISQGPFHADSHQRHDFPSNNNILSQHPKSSESFINAISSISQQGPNRFSSLTQRESIILPDNSRKDWLKRDTPRIEFAHSPRHSNVLTTPVTPAPPSMNYTTLTPINSNAPSTPTYDTRKDPTYQPRREPTRVVMRSVIGGKRNSQMNETATFGPNSVGRSGMQEESMCSSRDSGIEVLQYDWQAPCCRNE